MAENTPIGEPDYSEMFPIDLWIAASDFKDRGDPVPTDLLAALDSHGWDTRSFR